MKPIFKVGSHDYTEYIDKDGLKPAFNQIDKEGAGRNLLDIRMYRKMLGTKRKWSVSFLPVDESLMSQILYDMGNQYINITVLDARTNTHETIECYSATVNCGIQRYINGRTEYDGITFDVTER